MVHIFIFSETEEIKIVGLTPEREYVYRVASINDAGIGEFSENKTVRTGDYSKYCETSQFIFQLCSKVKQCLVLNFGIIQPSSSEGGGYHPLNRFSCDLLKRLILPSMK